jgi:hypothetical protein
VVVPEFAGSNPAEAVGFFCCGKSSACLPSEGKSNNLSHVPTLGHVKDPNFCGQITGCWLNSFRLLPSLIEVSRVCGCGMPLEMTEGTISDVGHKGPVYIRPRCITHSRIIIIIIIIIINVI